MNRVAQTVCFGLMTYVLLAGGVNVGWGQDISQLISTFNNLPQDQQNQLISQITGTISGGANPTATTGTTGTTGTTTTTGGGTTGGFPVGEAAIKFVIANSPGKQVEAAATGTPIFSGQTFQIPVDAPDFWDRVKLVFLDGLLQAITNIAPGLNVTVPVVSTAGQ